MLKMHHIDSNPSLLRKQNGNDSLTYRVDLKESYVKEITARVIGINSREVELDRTIFSPRGGGQPSDVGRIALNGNHYNVVDVKKAGETRDSETDRIFHTLEREPELRVGDTVQCTVDWLPRYKSMRLHSASHIIDGILLKNNYRCKNSSWHISKERYGASMTYEFLTEMTKERAEKIFIQAQTIIDQNLDITSKILTKEQAAPIKKLLVRTEPGEAIYEKLEYVRVVRIENFDEQMDGGTHVANTREIGRIELLEIDTKRRGKSHPTFRFILR